MTSKLNKPEKKNCMQEHRTMGGFATCHTCAKNKLIDEMDAYYKQSIKDNIPNEKSISKVSNDIRRQFGIVSTWANDIDDVLAEAIHKLIKERLQV